MLLAADVNNLTHVRMAVTFIVVDIILLDELSVWMNQPCIAEWRYNLRFGSCWAPQRIGTDPRPPFRPNDLEKRHGFGFFPAEESNIYEVRLDT